MNVETFKTDNIIFIGNVILCLTSDWPIVFTISEFIDSDSLTRKSVNKAKYTIKSYSILLWYHDKKLRDWKFVRDLLNHENE